MLAQKNSYTSENLLHNGDMISASAMGILYRNALEEKKTYPGVSQVKTLPS